ncbi:dihydroxyacetone kinase phosphoryl donor subunit DhaM [Luteimicrobium xylanilyticum]|uniref:Phosphocarrier protein HPr n=1 Tax=Luteimicrobium xylanilyticum TaxID=1133546 RepID=A0A5P9Q8U9_9MICO|nr:dihydroxyacetone kinase phosphoryl donor subunit DhaM [Luteimicrobium xylanilyticum]QFU97854.1 Phosphoenolpyruvate--glycerone phosphotransferase [Luteimicrobium xylanilyticum]
MTDPDTARTATALVLVSHSDEVARGTARLAAQMAPAVTIETAGGLPDGGLGTDFDRVQEAIGRALAAADGVVVLADLGSAILTVESVVEFLEPDDAARVHLATAPFVEGAVASAVAANGGEDADAVLRVAEDAGRSFGPTASSGPPSSREAGPGPGTSEVLRRTVTIRNPLGLHARPAAELARTASGFDAEVTVGGVEAASVLELMGLGATGGQEVEVTASGPQAHEALDAVAGAIEGGFGEA